MNPSKGTEESNPQKIKEEINPQGEVEITVETVDYRSPAGQDKEPKKENVQVIHQIHKDSDSGTGTGGGGLAGAAAAVQNTIQSAKDAVFGSGKDTAK